MPLRLLILGFALGAAWLQTRPALPPLPWFWALPPLAVVAAMIPESSWGRRLRALLLLHCAVAGGFFYAAWRAEMRLADTLPAAWEGREVRLVGRVLGLPETTARGTRFVLVVEAVAPAAASVPRRVMVSHYPRAEGPNHVPRGGACLTAAVRLGRPHGSINPGGFDYEGWLLERGIRAQGYATAGLDPSRDCAVSVQGAIDRVRERVRQDLMRMLAGYPHAGVVTALAVGDQNAIDGAQWALFRATGVTHLMSISGLHVTLLSGLVFGFVNLGWRRLGGLALRMPARRAATLAGAATALGYVALAGFGIPAQRTLFMLLGVAAALWLDRLPSPTRVLGVALAAVMVIDPWAALAPGFWLSFGAVAALLHASAGRLANPPLWLGWLRSQWAVTLALTPVLLLVFHEVSLVSPLANAFAIPLISLVAVPLVMLALVPGMEAAAVLAHAVIALALSGLEWLAALPQPVWHGAAPTPATLVLAVLGVLVWLLPRGVAPRWLAALFFLPLLLPRLERPAAGEFRLVALDVGQGLAVVVTTASHALVYDAGPAYASGDDAGARVVAPFLFGQGIRRLDGLIVSHLDGDHSGGAEALAISHAPARLLASAGAASVAAYTAQRPLPNWLGRTALCHDGQQWTWDGVRFEILNPSLAHYVNPNFSGNDLSCVLKVSGRHGSALLTGDIERLGELLLQERPQRDLRADVLIVPHHGSGGSSMAGLVARVRPRHALFSVGWRNRFGHPAAAVVARYREHGARIWRSDRQGALDVAIGPEGVSIVAVRGRQARYWHDRY